VSERTLQLFWNGRRVCLLRDVAYIDWPWMAGSFAAGELPKDLGDALAWSLGREEPGEGDERWPIPSALLGWSVREPDGTVREISVSRVDLVGGSLEWR
jgi:hypothetical protein